MPIDRIFAELHNPATWPPAPRPSMQPAYWRGLGDAGTDPAALAGEPS